MKILAVTGCLCGWYLLWYWPTLAVSERWALTFCLAGGLLALRHDRSP